MRALLILALLNGCAHRSVQSRDATLPEYQESLQAQSPIVLLEEATAQLDPTPRAQALGTLIRHAPGPGGHPWVRRGLWDPSPWVQRAAVEALGARAPEPEAIEAIESYLLRDGADPYVRGLAGRLLPSGAAPAALSALSEGCHAPSPAWQTAPLCLAAAQHGDTSAIPRLADALQSGDLPLDIDFLLAVGASGHRALIPALRQGAERAQEELRLPYAVARITLGDASGEQPLRRALADPDPQLRLEALDYISRLDDPVARPLLRRAQSQGPDLLRAYAQLDLAARAGDLDRIEAAAEHPNREVRALAIRFAVEGWRRSLGSKRASRMTQHVLSLGLQDPATPVRLAALDALAEIPLDGAEAAARHHLTHPRPELRLAAARALFRMGH